MKGVRSKETKKKKRKKERKEKKNKKRRVVVYKKADLPYVSEVSPRGPG